MKWDHFYKHLIVSVMITVLIFTVIKYIGAPKYMACHIAMVIGLGVGAIKERIIDMYPEFWDYEGDILGCVLGSFVGYLL